MILATFLPRLRTRSIEALPRDRYNKVLPPAPEFNTALYRHLDLPRNEFARLSSYRIL